MRPASPPPPAPLAPEDPFRYGWRDVKVATPDEGEAWERVPLTLEDVLHPQEGDHVVENNQHELDCRYLADVFSTRPLSPAHASVTRDLGIDWGVAGVGHHSPDVAVLVGMARELPVPTGQLDFAATGGRCELIVEVVSPNTRVNDVVHKFKHYHQVGVGTYVLIDQKKEGGKRTIRAYERAAQKYVPIKLDAQKQLLLPVLNLRMVMREERVVCLDAKTGKELGDYARITRELEVERREKAELKQKLEEQAQAYEEEVLARQDAERRAKDASQEAAKHRLAREHAEQQAASALQKLRDMEALLKTLQQSNPGHPT